jgi:hypothetical protein
MKKVIKKVNTSIIQSELIELFHLIRSLFPKEAKYMALGGSIALNQMRFITREAGDLDIMVSEKAVKFLDFSNQLMKLQNEKLTDGYSYGYSYSGANKDMDVINHYKFKILNGMKVCVFEHKHLDHLAHTAMVGNVLMAKPERIIQAKKLYIKKLKPSNESRIKHERDIKEIEKKLKNK